MNGQPVYGALNFVETPQHPESGIRTEHFRLFAPRLGLAYRLNDKTVIRTGAGIYYLPANLQFSEAPWGMTLSQFGNPWLATLDNGVTPNLSHQQSVSERLHSGARQPPARSGAGSAGRRSPQHAPMRTIPAVSVAVELRHTAPVVGRSGRRGGLRGIPWCSPATWSWQTNVLPMEHLSLGSALNTLVPNPFYGLVKIGSALAANRNARPTPLAVPAVHRRFAAGGYLGNSNYHCAADEGREALPPGRDRAGGLYVFQAAGRCVQPDGLARFRRGPGARRSEPARSACGKVALRFRLPPAPGLELFGRSPDRQGPEISEWRQCRRAEGQSPAGASAEPLPSRRATRWH